jgi:nucleotide-binding universal stress UspA family protein
MTINYRIVVGVDGSASGERALSWAIQEAARHGDGATVHALTVYRAEQLDLDSPWHRERRQRTASELQAEQVARALNDNPGVSLTTRVAEGDPVEALLHAARDADVLVLGSHGHGRLYHAVLGSVADGCVRRATCPVLIIPVPQSERSQPAPEATGVPAGLL